MTEPQTYTREELDREQTSTEHKRAVVPPVLREEPATGVRKEITSLDEGVATLTWPTSLSPESFWDLEGWTQGILRKAARQAGVEYPSKKKQED